MRVNKKIRGLNYMKNYREIVLNALRFITRSNLLEVFYKNVVLKNFAKFTGKHLSQSLFFNQVASLTLQLY